MALAPAIAAYIWWESTELYRLSVESGSRVADRLAPTFGDYVLFAVLGMALSAIAVYVVLLLGNAAREGIAAAKTRYSVPAPIAAWIAAGSVLAKVLGFVLSLALLLLAVQLYVWVGVQISEMLGLNDLWAAVGTLTIPAALLFVAFWLYWLVTEGLTRGTTETKARYSVSGPTAALIWVGSGLAKILLSAAVLVAIYFGIRVYAWAGSELSAALGFSGGMVFIGTVLAPAMLAYIAFLALALIARAARRATRAIVRVAKGGVASQTSASFEPAVDATVPGSASGLGTTAQERDRRREKSPLKEHPLPQRDQVDGTEHGRGRVLAFAGGRHLGTLYHRPPSDIWGGRAEWWPVGSSTEIRGSVSVPTDAQTRLWASQKSPHGQSVPARFEELSELEPSALDSLAAMDPASGWSADIRHLTGLSELVVAGWRNPTDDEVTDLLSFESLLSLDISYEKLAAEQIARLVAAHAALRFLYLAGTQTIQALATIGNLTGLRRLDLSNTDISDEHLHHVARLGNLESLILNECHVSDESAASVLGRMHNLETLLLNKTKVADLAVASLASPNLKVLSLNHTRVTGESLNPDAVPGLESLSVFDTPLTAEGLRQISRLPTLRYLGLIGAPLTDEGLGKLNGHPTLERLDLLGVPVSPHAILDLIESTPALRHIDRGLESYRTPQQIAAYAERLRKARPGATYHDPADHEPPPESVSPLEGTWRDLGEVPIYDGQHGLRFTLSRKGQVVVGYPELPTRGRNRPSSPSWQQPDWKPNATGPVQLLGANGFVAFGPEGILWIGDHSLWSYPPEDRDGAELELEASAGYFNCISFDADGLPWVTRNYSEVWRCHNNQWEQIIVPELGQNTSMNGIACHPDGSVWIASTAGLHRWDDGSWSHWAGPSDGLPEHFGFDAWEPSEVTPMNDVAVASDGSVWTCGGLGVARIRTEGVDRWNHHDGIRPFRKLCHDSETGAVFGIGFAAVSRFDGEGWQTAAVPDPYVGPRQRSGIVGAQLHNGYVHVLTGTRHLLRFEPEEV